MNGQRIISELSELIYNIHNFGINPNTREIFVNPINDDSNDAEIDHKTAESFVKNLTLLDSQSDNPVLIHMITCGGDWNYGIAMYDAIKSSRSYITTLSYAHAESMSSLIIQAADLRILMPNTLFMVHFCDLTTSLNAQSTTSVLEQFKKEKTMMLNMYAERCLEGAYFKEKSMDIQKTRRFLERQLINKAEWYMTAEEAMHMGYADGILGDEKYENVNILKART